MTLEDLVTDALAPAVVEDIDSERESVGSILNREVTAGELLHGGESMLTQMQSSDGAQFHFLTSQLAALFLSFSRSEYSNPYSLADQARSPKLVGATLFARAADCLHQNSGQEDILSFSRQALDNHYLKHFFANASEHVAYIEEIWGDEAVDRLSSLGGVQKSTARNWMRGSYPSSAEHTLRRTIDVLYHLKSSLGIDGQAAREWMETPLANEQTPFAIICNREQAVWNRRTGELKLDPLTTKLEEEGIVAFSWPATAR